MKTINFVLILLVISIFTACDTDCRNELDDRLKQNIEIEESVKKIVTLNLDSSKIIESDYHIGYNKDNNIVKFGNTDFYEYDSLDRVSKYYVCHLERDPCCKNPCIYFHEYKNGKINTRKKLEKLSNDTTLYEKFEYDLKNRLIEKVEIPNDTTKYFYILNDTIVNYEIWISWMNNVNGEFVRSVRKTKYLYDSLERKTQSTWIDLDDSLSMTKRYYYDGRNRLIMEKDSSLNSFSYRPNTCCIIYWTEYKYDEKNRIIEELNKVSSFDNPNPQFKNKTNFLYSKGIKQMHNK